MSDPEREDAVLVERVRRGDQRAFEALYDRYADIVFSLTARMLEREAAQEVVQEVFLTLWRKAERFEPARGSFSSWLLRIAHHRAIDELRRGRRRPQAQTLSTEDFNFRLEELPDTTPSADERIQAEVRGAAVAKVLSLLPLKQREVILLAYFQGLTQAEIAAKLSIPLGTVKKRIRLGLQKLKSYLAQDKKG